MKTIIGSISLISLLLLSGCATKWHVDGTYTVNGTLDHSGCSFSNDGSFTDKFTISGTDDGNDPVLTIDSASGNCGGKLDGSEAQFTCDLSPQGELGNVGSFKAVSQEFVIDLNFDNSGLTGTMNSDNYTYSCQSEWKLSSQ